jgi:hypothetical protein
MDKHLFCITEADNAAKSYKEPRCQILRTAAEEKQVKLFFKSSITVKPERP